MKASLTLVILLKILAIIQINKLFIILRYIWEMFYENL
jgi:hypothetical protein